MENGSPTPDLNDVSACTCANLRKASRVITQMYDAALRPLDLKATQFTLLATLALRGEMPLSRLADALVMDRTTLTRNLKPLIAKGLISSAASTDQRVRTIGLTAAGEAAFQQAKPAWQAVQNRVVQTLGPDRWTGLIDDLSVTTSIGIKS